MPYKVRVVPVRKLSPVLKNTLTEFIAEVERHKPHFAATAAPALSLFERPNDVL